MIVNVFYNKRGIGDVLIVSVQDVDCKEYTFEKKNNVVQIYNQKTKEICGYNIFSATNQFDLKANGKVNLTEVLLTQINAVIKKAGFAEQIKADLSPKFVIGLVEAKKSHPNADKLNICTVDIGKEKLQIVCGAQNVAAGQKVVIAKVGAVMPNGLVIKPSNLRGVDSFGMICSARELAMPEAPEEKGILVLDSTKTPGEPFVLEN